MSAQRGTVINVALDLVTEDCITCGVLFALPRELRSLLVDNHRNFYCPNGHQMAYTGKTEAQKQRERAEKAEQRQAWAESRANRIQQEREAAERSAIAYKGHVTRLRNRIANGVCPVQSCRRPFANVKAHIESQHPDWAHNHAEALS